jgi:hypothetical protein
MWRCPTGGADIALQFAVWMASYGSCRTTPAKNLRPDQTDPCARGAGGAALIVGPYAPLTAAKEAWSQAQHMDKVFLETAQKTDDAWASHIKLDLGMRRVRVVPADKVHTHFKKKLKELRLTELMKRWVWSPVQYVQITAEGLVGTVVQQLPFETPGFRPFAVVYNATRLGDSESDDVARRLRSFGYASCREGENVVALAV